MTIIYPSTTNDQAVALNIDNANKFHEVVNGSITTTVSTYEGNGTIPSVAKALFDAAAYKTPLAWESGVTETDLVQPRVFGGNLYVPLQVPAAMSVSPDSNWRLFQQLNGVKIEVEDQTGADIVSSVSTLTSTSYTVGDNNLFVYRNGSLQDKGTDYTETDSTSITWTGATPAGGDVIIFVVYKNVTSYQELSSKYRIISDGSTSRTLTASDNGAIIVFDTASAVTVTLPQYTTEILGIGFNVQCRNKQSGAITYAVEGSDVLAGAGSTTNTATELSSVYLESRDGSNVNTYVTVGDLA